MRTQIIHDGPHHPPLVLSHTDSLAHLRPSSPICLPFKRRLHVDMASQRYDHYRSLFNRTSTHACICLCVRHSNFRGSCARRDNSTLPLYHEEEALYAQIDHAYRIWDSSKVEEAIRRLVKRLACGIHRGSHLDQEATVDFFVGRLALRKVEEMNPAPDLVRKRKERSHVGPNESDEEVAKKGRYDGNDGIVSARHQSQQLPDAWGRHDDDVAAAAYQLEASDSQSTPTHAGTSLSTKTSSASQPPDRRIHPLRKRTSHHTTALMSSVHSSSPSLRRHDNVSGRGLAREYQTSHTTGVREATEDASPVAENSFEHRITRAYTAKAVTHLFPSTVVSGSSGAQNSTPPVPRAIQDLFGYGLPSTRLRQGGL